MKRNKPILDERILHLQEKINSNAFWILITLLFLSNLLKSLILDMPFKSYAFELAICLISLTYVYVKNIVLGNFLNAYSIKRKFLVSIIVGITASSIISLINYIKYGGAPILIFICFIVIFLLFFVGTFTILSISTKFSKKSLDKISKKYSDD